MNVTAPRAPLLRPLLAAAQVALLCAGAVFPAPAADPARLKDILGKAQTEAETKAVNDLITKLRGKARLKAPAAQPSSKPASPPPAAGAAPLGDGGRAADAPPVAPEGAAPPGQASIAAPTPTPPTPASPETAVEAAAGKRLPSVDLEIFFAYNSDEIGAEAVPPLRTLGQALQDASLADDAFLIAGHTDAKGGQRFNLDLSRRRAEAVKDFLVANFGIDSKRLVARGYGFAHLKNRTAPLSPENRRVQIVNLSKDARP